MTTRAYTGVMTKNRERRYIPDDSQQAFGLAIGGFVPLVIAGLLVPFRTDSVVAANIALVFVIVVVIAAAEGGRVAGVVAAVVSTLSFDFFFTRPFQSLKIDNADDIGTAVLLLVISLIVAQLVGFAHRSRQAERPQPRRHGAGPPRCRARGRRGADRRGRRRGRHRDHRAALAPRLPATERSGSPSTPGDRPPRRSTPGTGATSGTSSPCPTRVRSSACSVVAASSAASCSSPAPTSACRSTSAGSRWRSPTNSVPPSRLTRPARHRTRTSPPRRARRRPPRGRPRRCRTR